MSTNITDTETNKVSVFMELTGYPEKAEKGNHFKWKNAVNKIKLRNRSFCEGASVIATGSVSQTSLIRIT